MVLSTLSHESLERRHESFEWTEGLCQKPERDCDEREKDQGAKGAGEKTPAHVFATNRWMRSHPDETIDFLMSQYKLDRETAASSYDLYVPTLSDNGQIEDEYIQEIIDRWRQQTGSSATVPLDRIRDFSIVKELAGELGVH